MNLSIYQDSTYCSLPEQKLAEKVILVALQDMIKPSVDFIFGYAFLQDPKERLKTNQQKSKMIRERAFNWFFYQTYKQTSFLFWADIAGFLDSDIAVMRHFVRYLQNRVAKEKLDPRLVKDSEKELAIYMHDFRKEYIYKTTLAA